MEKNKKENLINNCWFEKGYIPKYLQLNDNQYETLWNMHPVKQNKVLIYNKLVKVPRWQQAYGKNYSFTGNTVIAKPLTEQLKKYIDWANKNELENGRTGELNGILINWYQDGNHYIGWHSDDERQLNKNSPIYTISFGAKRTFKIREKYNKKNVTNFELENNNFFIMGGNFQKYFQHQIPKRKKCSNTRISITIRSFLDY